jgi:hypothetical protein
MPKKPKAQPTDDRLATAIELLQQFVKRIQSENHRYCVFCEVQMGLPLDLHKKDCALRRATAFIEDPR